MRKNCCTTMGNRISKWWIESIRNCKNVTCFDDCQCFSCFRKNTKNKLNEGRSFTLETVSMPYIDEVGKLLLYLNWKFTTLLILKKMFGFTHERLLCILLSVFASRKCMQCINWVAKNSKKLTCPELLGIYGCAKIKLNIYINLSK